VHEVEEELRAASMEGDTSKIASMLAVGVNVNARDARDGDTALLRASSALQVAAIKVLLQHGALVNLCDMEGVSPLASTVDKSKLDRMGTY